MRTQADVLRDLDSSRLPDADLAKRRQRLLVDLHRRQRARAPLRRRAIVLARDGDMRLVAVLGFVERYDAGGINAVLRILGRQDRQRGTTRAEALGKFLARPDSFRALTALLAPPAGYVEGAYAVLSIGPRASLVDVRQELDGLPRSIGAVSKRPTLARHGWTVTLPVPQMNERSGRGYLRSMWRHVERQQSEVRREKLGLSDGQLTRRRAKKVPEAAWVARHLLGETYAMIAGLKRSRQIPYDAIHRFWLERGIRDYRALHAAVTCVKRTVRS